MKKPILILMALLMYFSSMAQTKVVIPKAVTTSKKTVSYLKYSDNYIDSLTGSNTVKRRDSLWLAKHKTPPVVIPPIIQPPNLVWETRGPGNGQLDLGADASNKNIRVAPGKYQYIGISCSNCRIEGTALGTVTNLSLYLGAGKNIEIFGFKWASHDFRPISVKGLIQGLYIHDMTFANVKDWTITNEAQIPFDRKDKTDKTVFLNWRIENCIFENANSPVNLGGGVNLDGTATSVSKGFKFLNNRMNNCDWGTVVSGGAMEDYEIAYNYITNQNLEGLSPTWNGNDNGSFAVTGNGTIHDNVQLNSQGHLTRSWLISLFGTRKSVKIYNNTFFNSIKYSAFEFQVPPDLRTAMLNGGFLPADGEITNNTVGRLNTSHDWDAGLASIYNTWSNIYVDKNLVYEAWFQNGRNGADNATLNTMHDPKLTKLTLGTNYYGVTWDKVVKDLNKFESIIPGAGAPALK